jgi:hypothetical protein
MALTDRALGTIEGVAEFSRVDYLAHSPRGGGHVV